MRRAHLARIHWSLEQHRRGLPKTTRIIDPAWLENADPSGADGWSLGCEFERSPAEQADTSIAQVHFLAAEAPHEQLRPGAGLLLFERATQQYAHVEILD